MLTISLYIKLFKNLVFCVLEDGSRHQFTALAYSVNFSRLWNLYWNHISHSTFKENSR